MLVKREGGSGVDGSGHGGGAGTGTAGAARGPVDADVAALRAVLGPEARTPVPKAQTGGHHRVEDPETTLARLLPRLADFGITRVARITGFDRAGIEVFTVIRPNARALSVANGKGVTRTASKVSGIMEAIERWHGERPLLPLRFGTAADVAALGARPCLDLPLSRPHPPGEPLYWAPALDLATGAAALVPFDAVDTCWLASRPPSAFFASTNGLASGSHPVEAALHGLCELVEHDSTALFDCLSPDARAARRIAPETAAPEPAALLADLAARNFAVALWETTSDVGVPAFACALSDTEAPRSPAGFGAGCHPDPATAAIRAITEAAQTRLIAMTGTRDDLDPALFAADVALRFRWAVRDTDGPAPRRLAHRRARLHRPPRRPRRHHRRRHPHRRRPRACRRPLPRARPRRDPHPRPRPRDRQRSGRRPPRPPRRPRSGAHAMTAIVFVGPSLAGRPVAVPPGIALRPPATAGDLYRAARAGARVIGLIDGVFEDRPTVWHKEILYALAQGTRVLGAASLGALRAAECAPFGMEGIGTIFARLRDGALEDDHELALAYAPRELDYTPVSEPLVNVRATLDAAVAAGTLTEAQSAALLATALALPYKAITWRRLAATLPDAHRPAFDAWLPEGRVDLKRADALALLDAVAAAETAQPAAAPFTDFSDTRYWRSAVASFERGGTAVPADDQAVLDELRLDPARYHRALVRAYAARAAHDTPLPPETDAAVLLDDLRLDLGLTTAQAFRAWCAATRTRETALADALLAEERLLHALEAAADDLAPAILDALRLDGRFARLDRRAADKRTRLAATPEPVFREADLPALIADLSARARASTDSDDPDVVALSLGLADRRALHRLLAREQAYRTAGGEP